MIFLLLTWCLLSGWLCASETDITVLVKLQTLTTGSTLYYMPPQLIDECNEIGIVCNYNTPFVMLEHSIGDCIATSKNDLILPPIVKNLQALPIDIFTNKTSEGVVCAFSLTKSNKKVYLRCHQTKINKAMDRMKNNFRQNVQSSYWTIVPAWCSNIIGSDYGNLEQFYLKKKILEKQENGEFIHGPEGYFKEEYAQKKLEEKQAQQNNEKIYRRALYWKYAGLCVILVFFKICLGEWIDNFFQHLLVGGK